MSARRETNWCINCVLMRAIDALKETIADVSSVSPLSERIVNGSVYWSHIHVVVLSLRLPFGKLTTCDAPSVSSQLSTWLRPTILYSGVFAFHQETPI